MNGRMTEKDFEELVSYLDARIDELTKPLPSKQILRFAEAIRSANTSEMVDDESADTYNEDDLSNLMEAHEIVTELLPNIIDNIRGKSIDPATGWRFTSIERKAYGDCGLCAICRKPYQHMNMTVTVHHLDMHQDAYRSACRECVRTFAPLSFVDKPEVSQWLDENPTVCEAKLADNKIERQRISLIDAVRRFAHSTHYFGRFFQKSSEWLQHAFHGEWR